MCGDGNFRPHYTQTEDYSFAVTAAFDTPVKTKGNLSQTPLLALTDVETHAFGTLIFGWMLNVSMSRDATTWLTPSRSPSDAVNFSPGHRPPSPLPSLISKAKAASSFSRARLPPELLVTSPPPVTYSLS